MSIRIRKIDGVTIALCAVESDPKPDDLYLDDATHYALAAKFAQDWQGQKVDWDYPIEWEKMDGQRKRDAKDELIRWLDAKLKKGPI